MKAILKNRLVLCLMLILALTAASFTGCEIDESTSGADVEGAPTIPPVSTFLMDFDDFNAGAETASTVVSSETSVQPAGFTFGEDDVSPLDQYTLGSQSNWNFAAFNVGVWNAIIAGGLAVPVAAFGHSFNHTPVQQEDYTWVWRYDVKVGLVTHTAELHGKFKEDENGIRWDMYISKEGEYEDFHWYYGESNLPATEGFWILKNKPSDPTDLLRIDWERDLAENTWSITYTNIVPDGKENGGYISYGATTDETYNRFYEIYNKGDDKLTNIEWNNATKEGRVKAPHNFDDDEWHCWDADHNNIEVSA